MKIGAHVSSAGGLHNAVDNAVAIEAEAIQCFVSGPTNWRVKDITGADYELFKTKAVDAGIGLTYFHGVYLINFGSPNPEFIVKSVDSLTRYQQVAAGIGGAGTIFHVGSHKNQGFEQVLPQVISCMTKVLEATPDGPDLIIENSAGMGHSIGSSWSEIGQIIKGVGSPKVKVCLDTQHSFANGYNLAHKDGINEVMDEFDREIGIEKLVAVHANDSKVPFLGGLDRHENIGKGYIGLEGFQTIMAHPAFQKATFLLEVPGLDGEGVDKENVQILKKMRG